MTGATHSSIGRSLGVGAAVVLAFLAVLEATRRLDFDPGALGNRPLVVTGVVLAAAAVFLVWLLTESAFD